MHVGGGDETLFGEHRMDRINEPHGIWEQSARNEEASNSAGMALKALKICKPSYESQSNVRFNFQLHPTPMYSVQIPPKTPPLAVRLGNSNMQLSVVVVR